MPDLETLEAECEELLSTIRRIDLQLSERKPVGRVPDDEYREYREWRSAALCAKSKATTKYRAKRKALKEARHAANMPRPEAGGASLDALCKLVEAGCITPDCDLGAAGRARETLHRLAPELIAVVEAARMTAVTTYRPEPALVKALAALDAKLAGGE